MGEVSSNLERLFPGKRLKYGGLAVTVRPLSIEQLGQVADSVIKIYSLLSQGKTEAEIASVAIKEVLDVAKYCLDVPISDIPVTMAPELCMEIIRQNLNKDILGKWKALYAEVAALGVQGQSN